MKIKILTLLLLLTIRLGVSAQIKSLNIGIVPGMGIDNVNIKHWQIASESFEKEYKMHYKPITGINIALENVLGNKVFVLGELAYSRAFFDEFERLGGSTLPLLQGKMKDVNIYSACVLFGIRPGGRVQLPIGIGPSVDYISGTPFKHLFVDLNADIRIRIYVARAIAIFGGLRAKIGYSFGNTGDYNERKKKLDAEDTETSEHLIDMDLHFFRATAYPQIGITFTLGGK